MSAASAHLDFVVIGAMKAGTTSVFEFLAAHPDVCAPRNKEPHYFTRGYRLPASYYRWLFRHRREGQICGEASPTYSWVRRYPQCPARLAVDAPDVRLVYLVRDPVERLLSHYRHHLLLGQGPGDDDEGIGHRDLWDRSRYRDTIEAYLRHFPRDRLFVADIDVLQREPLRLHGLLDFLGLDPSDAPPILPTANVSAGRLAVPGRVGRLARTPVGSVIRDLVPGDALRWAKRQLARGTSGGGTGAVAPVEWDAAAVRSRQLGLSAEVDPQYAWVAAEFLGS